MEEKDCVYGLLKKRKVEELNKLSPLLLEVLFFELF